MSSRINSRELRRIFTQALGEFRPAAIMQLLEMELGPDMSIMRQTVRNIILNSCREFIMHARKWIANPEYKPLQVMCEYDMLWEGFSCDEPYSSSKDKKLKYFMDCNYNNRIQEMNDQFIDEPLS